jgi:hypothetical protein
MAAKNPRVHIVLEQPLYEAVAALARQNGVSLSLAARDLIKEALELYEDLALGQIAEERRRTSRPAGLIPHREMLRRRGVKS